MEFAQTASLRNLVLSASGTLAAYALYKLARYLLLPSFSPLRVLPGPPNPNWLYGHFKEIFAAGPMEAHEKWVETYGPTLKYKGILNRNRLLTADLKAINHVLARSDIYEKPDEARENIIRIFGPGLLTAEGEVHKQQRKIMNPAFGPAQVRELTGIFLDKSNHLRDIWLDMLASQTASEPKRMDALAWLSRATLDIIGLAGFNYTFDALTATDENPNELNTAFSAIFAASTKFSLLPFLAFFIPPLRHIPTKTRRAVDHGRKVMYRIGTRLVAEKKAAILAAQEAEKGQKSVPALQGRDLLSLLVRANMAKDLSDRQRLSDEDVVAQIPTFLIAGHETTSTATTWALYALSLAPEFQTRLRAELNTFALPTGISGNEPLDSETLAALNALPFLDAVVRETLRLHAPVASTIRVARADDAIPLAKPFVDINGVTHDSITVSKGDPVFIPVLLINRSKELWGEDAREFNPDRWLDPPKAISAIPGVWSNLLTFIGGPHACIGYRFSLIEMKILLFVLVRAFSFRLAVDPSEIIKRSSLVTRPLVTSEKENGQQMPLFITPVDQKDAE